MEHKKKMKLGRNNPACALSYAAIILCFAGQTAQANPISADMPPEAVQADTPKDTHADSLTPSGAEIPPPPTKTETSGEKAPQSSGDGTEDSAQETDISAL